MIFKQDDAWEKPFQEIAKELANQEECYSLYVSTILEQLFIRMLRQLLPSPKKESAISSTSNDRLSLILDEAFLYSYKDLSLEKLGNMLGMGKRQAERLVTKKYGVSFVKYRTISRLNAAEQMLAETDLSIAEIAEKCGFTVPAYLSVKNGQAILLTLILLPQNVGKFLRSPFCDAGNCRSQ